MSTPIPAAPHLDLVAGRPVTTSINIAEVFSKQHKDVLKAINGLEVHEEFRRRNFAPSNYLSRGKSYLMYQITRDGFTLLAMGFTGRQAMQFKLAYIEAFNAMEARLAEPVPGKFTRVDINHRRLQADSSGLDIRYTLDLTKIILRPTRTSLLVLERLTGIACEDLAEELDRSVPGSHVGQFVAERLVAHPGARVSLGEVHDAYLVWCRANSVPAAAQASNKRLAQILREGGYDVAMTGGRSWVFDALLTGEAAS